MRARGRVARLLGVGLLLAGGAADASGTPTTTNSHYSPAVASQAMAIVTKQYNNAVQDAKKRDAAQQHYDALQQTANRRDPAPAKQRLAAQSPITAPNCSGTLYKLGACPSESGAAGTTAAQVKASVIGGGLILLQALPGVGELADALGIGGDAASVFADGTAAARASDQVVTDVGADARAADGTREIPSCGGNSFTAGTLVLLASGKAIPISQLKAGDKVLATDTRTGKDQPEAVTAVLVHHDTNLYDLTVKTKTGTEVIHTTASHLFWDPYLHYGWIPAKRLKPGMRLKAPDGQLAVVVGGSVPAVHDGWMWDLTVPGNNDHDFYVLAGATSVLVHNSSPGCELGPDGWPKPTMDNCEACAQKIQDKIGGEIYQISDSMGAPRLGPSVNDPNGQWFEHFAVVKDGTVYDAFTGSRGMPLDEYRSQWDYGEYLKFTPYNPGG